MSNGAYGGGMGTSSRRPAKILPPFLTDEDDLNTVDSNGVPYRELWKRVAIKFFENDSERPIDYDITDPMILAYSSQFQELARVIEEQRKTMKTWQQLAIEAGQLPSTDPKKPTTRELPPADRPYFAIEWLAIPIHNGPVEHACGCGCGCGGG